MARSRYRTRSQNMPSIYHGPYSREEDAAAPASELNRSCRPGERFGDSTSVRDSEIIDRRLAPRRERVTRKPSLILPDRGDQNWLWKRSRLHGQVDSFRIADDPGLSQLRVPPISNCATLRNPGGRVQAPRRHEIAAWARRSRIRETLRRIRGSPTSGVRSPMKLCSNPLNQ